jgi:hypothetical protein
VRIGSTFIADFAEVNRLPGRSVFGPVFRARSQCQRFPSITSRPWRWSSGWQLTNTDEHSPSRSTSTASASLTLMLHQDFSFEIPRGMHVVDGVSHHYPSTFSMPVDFNDVRLHSVIVGDEDSDVAHVPFSPRTSRDARQRTISRCTPRVTAR